MDTYTKLIGNELELLGFTKRNFMADRYSYTKKYIFGELTFIDGDSKDSKHNPNNILLKKNREAYNSRIEFNIETMEDLISLIIKLSHEHGVEAGKKIKVCEIRNILDLN